MSQLFLKNIEFNQVLGVIEKLLDRVLIYKMNMEIVSGKHGL